MYINSPENSAYLIQSRHKHQNQTLMVWIKNDLEKYIFNLFHFCFKSNWNLCEEVLAINYLKCIFLLLSEKIFDSCKKSCFNLSINLLICLEKLKRYWYKSLKQNITVYIRLLAALFYLEYGLFFAWDLYAQHTQRDKVFAWAITEFQSSSRTANAIWQWAKVGRYHVSVKIRWHLRRSTVLVDERPSSDEEDFLGFEQ